MRCDRDQPCSSCVKRGDTATCEYQGSTGSSLITRHRSVAEDRLEHLESIVKHLMQNQRSPQYGKRIISKKPVTPPELNPVPVDAGDQTTSEHVDIVTYVGFTHWSAILDDIHDLKEVLGSASINGEAEEDIASEASALDSDLIFGSSKAWSLQQIIDSYLPPKVEVDRFLSIYFSGETFIVPFVHTYHFQDQYRDFWADCANVNPLWLSMLFSICFMASLTGGATDLHALSHIQLANGRHNIFHKASGQCLVLGKYHRPQQFAVEALLMYAHCKNVRTLEPSREAGTILGMVVRMAYEMGYHRDPDSFGSFTVFEGEMRRRFWAVCKQMDLMTSFMLGLPSNIRLDSCDTKSPRNLLDADFDTTTEVLPKSRSENEPTKILWFIVKDRQMISFSKVCQEALSFKDRSEAEIFQLDEEIRQMFMTIPDVLRTRPVSDSIADSPFLIMTRLYVEFIHLKSLCVLHRKYMARGHIFSTISCVEAGKSLVSQFIDIYKEFSQGGQLYKERWMLGNFTMNDFLLGVMVLCLVVHTHWKRGSQGSAINAATEGQVLALLERSHAICVEKSSTSRDAWRVSHAVRLTLNRAKSSNAHMNDTASNPFVSSPSAFLSMASAIGDAQGGDTTPGSSSQPLHGHGQGDEAVFGLLDPFNFIGNNSTTEGIDWTGFSSQILEENTPWYA